MPAGSRLGRPSRKQRAGARSAAKHTLIAALTGSGKTLAAFLVCVERRQRVESRLRTGDLRALVATASPELGIDVGPAELVCQIGSPRSFAMFLQRVGRSNHSRDGVPAGRLYPTSRDELVECAALLRGTRGVFEFAFGSC